MSVNSFHELKIYPLAFVTAPYSDVTMSWGTRIQHCTDRWGIKPLGISKKLIFSQGSWVSLKCQWLDRCYFTVWESLGNVVLSFVFRSVSEHRCATHELELTFSLCICTTFWMSYNYWWVTGNWCDPYAFSTIRDVSFFIQIPIRWNRCLMSTDNKQITALHMTKLIYFAN